MPLTSACQYKCSCHGSELFPKFFFYFTFGRSEDQRGYGAIPELTTPDRRQKADFGISVTWDDGSSFGPRGHAKVTHAYEVPSFLPR